MDESGSAIVSTKNAEENGNVSSFCDDKLLYFICMLI